MDDGCLQYIFHKVGDARQLARCSMVCKQWRDACYSASRLIFTFQPKNQEEMWELEHAISTVLQRSRTKSSGCLKKLKVHFLCHPRREHLPNPKASAFWLAHPDSLTSLNLTLEASQSLGSASWGPAVWSYVLGSSTLEKLVISSGSFFTGKMPMVNWVSPRLKKCTLDSVPSVSVEVIQGILAASPVLEQLYVVNFHVLDSSKLLTVSSASLTRLSLSCSFRSRDGRFELVFRDAPSLTELRFCGLGQRNSTNILRTVQPMEKLIDLGLEHPCTLDKVIDKLEKLRLSGRWDVPEQVSSVLKKTPTIRYLDLGCRFRSRPSPGLLFEEFSGLLSLKHLYLISNSLKISGKSSDSVVTLEGLTVHLRVDINEEGAETIAEYLLDSCQVQMLEVNFNCSAEDVQCLREKLHLQDLFDVLDQHRDRVSFNPV